MKPGDLIQDKETKDVGLIVEIDPGRTSFFRFVGVDEPYLVLGVNGVRVWLDKDYVEEGCEIINEGR